MRRTVRKIRRLKCVVAGMCPAYSDSADPNRLLAAGALKANVDRVMPLAEAAMAHWLFEGHQAELNGKIDPDTIELRSHRTNCF